MVFLGQHHRIVQPTKKKASFGHFTITTLLQDQLCPSVWLRVIKMINHMLCLVDITLLKSQVEKLEFRPSRTILEITKVQLEAGLLIPKTSFMIDNPCNTRIRQNHLQLSLILEAHLLLFLQNNTLFQKDIGHLKFQVLIVKSILHSVKSISHALRLRNKSNQSDSKFRIPFLNSLLKHIFTRDKVSASLLLQRTHLMN